MSGEAYQRVHQAWNMEELLYVARDFVNGTEENDGDSATAMIVRFRELGYEQMAKETAALLYEIVRQVTWLETSVEELRPYWRALAWLDAGDTGIETFKKQMEGEGR